MSRTDAASLVTPELLYRFMRVVPWATPRRVRRLTDRQILRIAQAQDNGTPDGDPTGVSRTEVSRAFAEPGSAEEYAGWRFTARMLGMTDAQADDEWRKKRGPVPGELESP